MENYKQEKTLCSLTLPEHKALAHTLFVSPLPSDHAR